MTLKKYPRLWTDTNYANGYILLTESYLYANEYNQSMSLVEKAMQLNPHCPAQYPGLYGQTYLLLGQYAEAKKWLEKSLLINPSLVYNNAYLTVLLYRMGNVEEAQWQYERPYPLDATIPFFVFLIQIIQCAYRLHYNPISRFKLKEVKIT